MKCFTLETVNNDKFPNLSKRMNYIKNDEAEVDDMCSLIEDYANEKSQMQLIELFQEKLITKETVMAKLGISAEEFDLLCKKWADK